MKRVHPEQAHSMTLTTSKSSTTSQNQLPRNTISCIAFVLGVLLMSPFNTQASENNKTLHEWYNHYYHHQNNRLLIKAIDYFYSSNVPDSELKRMSRQGFFSALFQQQPQQAKKALARSHLSSAERLPLLLALSSAGLTRQALKWANRDKLSNKNLLRLNHPSMSLQPARLLITQDSDLGFLWEAFKASGNKLYLDKILDTLLQQSSAGNNQPDEALITTAIQTLLYHRAHDSFVDDHYLSRYAKLSPQQQAQLDILFASHEGEDDSLDCD